MGLNRVRVLGNLLLLVGQGFILFGTDPTNGLIIKILGSILLIKAFLDTKSWDMVFTKGAFSGLELSKLFSIFFRF